MAQTSKEITRWHCGCNFRLVLVLLKTWVLWVMSGLDAIRHSQNYVCWQLVNTTFFFFFFSTLLFIKLCNWLPGYKSLQSARFRLEFQAYSSEMRFILPIISPVVTPSTTSNYVYYTKMADQGTEILIIQDSDLGLGTQKYFQFRVYSPN